MQINLGNSFRSRSIDQVRPQHVPAFDHLSLYCNHGPIKRASRTCHYGVCKYEAAHQQQELHSDYLSSRPVASGVKQRKRTHDRSDMYGVVQTDVYLHPRANVED